MREYKLIRSRRKTLGLQVIERSEVIVRAQLRISKREIGKFVQKQDAWIDKHLIIIETDQKNSLD